MQHRELYRSIVPENACIITYSDLASCCTCSAAKRIANDIYYKIGSSSYSSDAQKDGTKAHSIKEADVSPKWDNELRLAYNISDEYYICGTIDRYHKEDFIVEDYKTTTVDASMYVKTKQVDVYSFLAINNKLPVTKGKYTTIDKEGNDLTTVEFEVNPVVAVDCYMSYILPRFNMIKHEIERLKQKYVRIDGNTKDVCSINS